MLIISILLYVIDSRSFDRNYNNSIVDAFIWKYSYKNVKRIKKYQRYKTFYKLFTLIKKYIAWNMLETFRTLADKYYFLS